MYFLTAIHNSQVFHGETRSIVESCYQDKRTFGYFKLYDAAKNAIDNNTGNMQECWYNYLVLEYIPEGIHGKAENEEWFEWYDKDGAWIECEKPAWAQGIVNWAIG